MKTALLGFGTFITLVLSGPGCGPPQGQTTTDGGDGARISVVSVELRGRGDRRTVERAVATAAQGVRCARTTGEATLFVTIGNDGQVSRLDLQEDGGGIRAGSCIIPQLRAALAGSAPAGARVVVRIRAE